MEKIFFEYYSLSLNDICCVFVLLRRAFHSSKLPWEWSFSLLLEDADVDLLLLLFCYELMHFHCRRKCLQEEFQRVS